MGDIVKQGLGDLLAPKVPGEDSILGFFMPDQLGTALQEEGLGARELLREIGSILRDDRVFVSANGTERLAVSAKEKLGAIKMVLDWTDKAAMRSGLIEKVTGRLDKELPDGTRATLDSEGYRLLEAGTSRTMRTLDLLEQGETQRDLIDLEVIEDGSKRTDSREPSPNDGAGDPEPQRAGAIAGGGGSDGSGNDPTVHGEERVHDNRGGETPACTSTESDDQRSVQGADDERGAGIPQQSGRSVEGEGLGEQGERDRVGDKPNPKPTEWWNKQRAAPSRDVRNPPAGPHPYVPGVRTRVPDADAIARLRKAFGDKSKSPPERSSDRGPEAAN